MPKSFAPRDVELLGYTTAHVRESADAAEYTVIDATAAGGLETIRTQFIYLKSKCTLEEAEAAASQLNRDRSAHVVTPPSLRVDEQQLRRVFGPTVHISSHDDLVWQKLRTVFSSYLASLSDIHVDPHFIPPRSLDDAVGVDLVPRLIDYMSGQTSREHGTLRVLSAHAGVGKTTVSRHLIQALLQSAAKYKTIPIYIESEHWRKLDLRAGARIDSDFRYAGSMV